MNGRHIRPAGSAGQLGRAKPGQATAGPGIAHRPPAEHSRPAPAAEDSREALRHAEARRRARTAAGWQLARGSAALAVVVGALALIPTLQVRSFQHDEQLRAHGPVLSAPVRYVQVHDGKSAWVEVDVDANPAGLERDVEVSDSFDLDHPPELGQHLQVVVDPADPDHVVLTDSPKTLASTSRDAALTTLLVAGLAGLAGWSSGFPPLATLRAVRARSALTATATVVRSQPGTPPQGRVYGALRSGKLSDFAEVDLLLDPVGPQPGPPGEQGGAMSDRRLTGWFLVEHNGDGLRAGERVRLIGQPTLGGRCALVAARPAFAATALAPAPDRPTPRAPAFRAPAAHPPSAAAASAQYRPRRRVYIDADGYERRPQQLAWRPVQPPTQVVPDGRAP